MLVSQLINLTISKEEELAKQKALKANPELANGQDLTSSEDLTPVQTFNQALYAPVRTYFTGEKR